MFYPNKSFLRPTCTCYENMHSCMSPTQLYYIYTITKDATSCYLGRGRISSHYKTNTGFTSVWVISWTEFHEVAVFDYRAVVHKHLF